MTYPIAYRLTHMLLAVCVFIPAHASKPETSNPQTSNPETLVERSQTQANDVLDRMVEAFGGVDTINSIERIRLTIDSEVRTRLQMTTASPPFTAGTQRETLLLDLSNNQVRSDQSYRFAGSENEITVVIRNGSGMNYDHRARTSSPIPPAQASQQTFVQHQRRLPNLIVRQALARRNSLRYLGEERYNGRLHDVLTFVMADAQQIGLYIDRKTGLISKYELMIADPLVGTDVLEVRYGAYEQIGKHRVPKRWSFWNAGEENSRFMAQVEINPAINETSFAVEAANYAQIEPSTPETKPFVETLADGVYVLHHFAGANQNAMAVVFKDYVLAIEAPGTSAGTDAAIEKIKELAPGKPLRYLAMTHHHGDHIGGLRSYIAEGAEIVTTAGNVALVKALSQAPQQDRLSRQPRELKIGLIENSKRIFDDGTQRVELIDIGPHPHAREMVIAWLPKHQIVFQHRKSS